MDKVGEGTPSSYLEGLTGPSPRWGPHLARLGQKCLQTARAWATTAPGKHTAPPSGLLALSCLRVSDPSWWGEGRVPFYLQGSSLATVCPTREVLSLRPASGTLITDVHGLGEGPGRDTEASLQPAPRALTRSAGSPLPKLQTGNVSFRSVPLQPAGGGECGKP